MNYQVTDKSTPHSSDTPHGLATPHRYPVKTSTQGDLAALVNSLYPTGRAWWLPENSNLRALHEAMNLSYLRLIDTAYAVFDSTFPDNINFTEDDATLWEYRLGIENPGLTLDERKANLLRKWSFRKNLKARQSLKYINGQLNDAGFDVKVHENLFFDDDGNKYYLTPSDILGTQVALVQHGGSTEHGDGTQHGAANFEVIANSSEREEFNIGGADNLWATFYIAGHDLNYMANVPKNREKEFRNLVLKLKPAHLVAFLFVNYV